MAIRSIAMRATRGSWDRTVKKASDAARSVPLAFRSVRTARIGAIKGQRKVYLDVMSAELIMPYMQ